MLAALLTAVCLVLPPDAVVIDTFRAPSCVRCAGNRGVELAMTPGRSLVAGLGGEVSYAGLVGGQWYVVVRSDVDRRVRVTYGGLRSVAVSTGERVQRGDRIGEASATLHVGVRVHDVYIDPLGVVDPPGGVLGSAPPRFRVTLGAARAPACAPSTRAS